MKSVTDAEGHRRYSLGPVEIAILAAIPVVLATLLGIVWTMFTGQLNAQGKTLEKQEERLQELVTQQAVSNKLMSTLTTQLADFPTMTRDMAELKVRVSRHDEDIKELRDTRGLR